MRLSEVRTRWVNGRHPSAGYSLNSITGRAKEATTIAYGSLIGSVRFRRAIG